MATSPQNLTALFRVCLEIVNPNKEGPQLSLQLLVNPVSHTVTGTGLYTSSPLEPAEVPLNIRGQYFESGDIIIVSFTGYNNGTPFLRGQMRLDNWKEGQGYFRELNGIPVLGKVIKVPC